MSTMTSRPPGRSTPDGLVQRREPTLLRRDVVDCQGAEHEVDAGVRERQRSSCRPCAARPGRRPLPPGRWSVSQRGRCRSGPVVRQRSTPTTCPRGTRRAASTSTRTPPAAEVDDPLVAAHAEPVQLATAKRANLPRAVVCRKVGRSHQQRHAGDVEDRMDEPTRRAHPANAAGRQRDQDARSVDAVGQPAWRWNVMVRVWPVTGHSASPWPGMPAACRRSLE